MNYGQQENARVKEQIVKGLFTELKTKPFSEIRIASLIKTAGVGRTSYYRNFDSKEEIVDYYLSELVQVRRSSQSIPTWTRSSVADNLEDIFSFFLSQKERFLLLFKSGLSSYVFDYFRNIPKNNPQEGQQHLPNHNPYLLAFFTGALPSVLFEWLKRDSPESPKEMAVMLTKMLPPEIFVDEK
ncbi:TetR/AcrR family transcriptional regulator [Fructobacillus durionis]|uniref:Transcriptional regulator, TetR family n=1 Tax=Fructobacillus durionis TaxID=283737 RepID=A0A1I1GEV1_9LACO|nr:TetR/AcrR family transcriptional regulator [Fructobacillus durionis]SFC10279.1 transcriptional regulator, TetR family [Fructobacillus durionis]